ncbi:hypothetical protein ACFL6I_25730 [candidate division KSB1 bacterium]
MKKAVKKTIKKTAGATLITVGVVGLFVPILQGIALIIVGAVLLEHEPINDFGRSVMKKCEKIKKRYT